MIPQPQVVEYCDEIPPEFTRSSFADLFDRAQPPLQSFDDHVLQDVALKLFVKNCRPSDAARR